MIPTGICVDCERPIMFTKKPPAGMLRHKAHGRCCGCDSQARKTLGRLTPRPKLVDELAISCVVDEGIRMPLRPAERRIAVALLSARGLTVGQIAERVGITPRSVDRYRAKARTETTETVSTPLAKQGCSR